jgi:site-specific recombinase XerD
VQGGGPLQGGSIQGGSAQAGLAPPPVEQEELAPPPRQTALLTQESAFPRELAEHEIHVLLEAADGGTRRWIGLLLSGLSVEEAASLGAEHLDLTAGRILVFGKRPRTLPLAPYLKACLVQSSGLSAATADEEEVETRIRCAAFDSGLPNPDTLDAVALRHTYLAFLVRQGIRLAELESVVGRLPARHLANYGRLSPLGAGLPAERVTLIHPALLDGGAAVG